jgi:hypothetical protein
MKPVEFEGQTGLLAPPPGTPRGECGALPVLRQPWGFASVWKPTPEELAVLNAGGHVRLAVHGIAHPPVRLDAITGVQELA